MPRLKAAPSVPDPVPGELVPLLLAWFAANARDLPWRRTRDPYAIWISEIMLQQTQVKTVIPYWERWLRTLPDARALAEAPEDRVLKLWEGLGYYTRARNLQRAARVVLAEHGGTFPNDHAALLALPGIGRYTAGAIASIAFNQPAPILDGNVIRVLTRVFALPGDPKEKALNGFLWQIALALVKAAANRKLEIQNPKFALFTGNCSLLNQSLMELGAMVCTPRAPACLVCPLAACCVASSTGRAGEFPQLGERAAATARRFVVVVLEREGKFLVRQRPAKVVNAGLWEFPNEELADPRVEAAVAAAQWLGLPRSQLSALKPVKHTITRYRITLEIFRAEAGKKRLPAESGAEWRELTHLEQLAFTSAHRRIVRQLG